MGLVAVCSLLICAGVDSSLVVSRVQSCRHVELACAGGDRQENVVCMTWCAVGVARFIDASIYRDTFPAICIAILFFTITIFFFFFLNCFSSTIIFI